MNFEDSFLLLLLVGFCSATVHLQINVPESKVPYKFCLKEDVLCTSGDFSSLHCMNMSLQFDIADNNLLRLVDDDGRTWFATDDSYAREIQDYAYEVSCGRRSLPLTIQKITYENGVNVWLLLPARSIVSSWNYTEEDYTQSSTKRIEMHCGRLTAVSVNIKEGRDVNKLDKFNLTALAWAAAFGDSETVQKLINQGADLKITYDNITIAQIASYSCNADVLDLLLKNGVSTEVHWPQGLSLLHIAAAAGSVNVTKLLLSLDKTNINLKGIQEGTPLLLAAAHEDPELLLLLISSGADVLAKDTLGNTALHFQAKFGRPETIEKLVKLGIPVDNKDTKGRTPLMFAAERNNPKIVETLINLGAKINVVDAEHRSIIDYYARRGSEVYRMLLEHS